MLSKTIIKYLGCLLLIGNLPTHASPLAEEHPSRIMLAQRILTMTQAEKDVRLEVHHQLSQSLWPQIKEDGYLNGLWNGLWQNYAIEPEMLINKEAIKDIIRYQKINAQEDIAFRRIDGTLRAIEEFNHKLQDTSSQGCVTLKPTQALNTLSSLYQCFKVLCIMGLLTYAEKSFVR